MFQLSDYDYHLPEALIAQHPCKERSESRLLHVNRKTGQLSHCRFKDVVSLLNKGDLLVINNTRVVPARLLGKKETGGRVEVLIIDYAAGMKHLKTSGVFQCECLVKASKSPKAGARILLEGQVQAEVVKKKGPVSVIRFSNSIDFLDFLQTSGRIPLPPYIKRNTADGQNQQDQDSYQTVYASKKGAVAAPTAGLHFTDDLMTALGQKGVKTAEITLHVGYGTFVPVKVSDIREHRIHSEYFTLSKKSAGMINQAKAEGRRVVAVGTTSVRTLEYLSDNDGLVAPQEGMCDLFIYPGYQFRCVDAMITNFHLPESTLLMLISAFYSREKILAAYEAAKLKHYRFYSYGDAMLIE